jgi:hypothetical protein
MIFNVSPSKSATVSKQLRSCFQSRVLYDHWFHIALVQAPQPDHQTVSNSAKSSNRPQTGKCLLKLLSFWSFFEINGLLWRNLFGWTHFGLQGTCFGSTKTHGRMYAALRKRKPRRWPLSNCVQLVYMDFLSVCDRFSREVCEGSLSRLGPGLGRNTLIA